MADDDFVDIGLSKFFRLDLVFLAGTQQVVQKRHVKLQDLDKLDNPPIGDIEFAVKIKRPRIAVASVDCDFSVVDVAGELGSVLVFFVFGLEGADANAVFFAQDDTSDADVLDHPSPVAIVFF